MTVLYEERDGRATVTIQRPESLNALDRQTLTELKQAFDRAASEDRVGVVILTGAGDRAFCTGADLREQQQFLARPHDYWKWFGVFSAAIESLMRIGKPTIARLNGAVVGGGNELNIACDLAVASEHVTIRQVGNSRGSVAAGGATQWLPLIVGDRRAREMLWLNEPIPARQALEWGLVNEVAPREELDAAVDRMAEKLLRKMPEVMRYTKAQIGFWRELSWAMTISHARDWLSLHSDSAEVAEGLGSFFEKRAVNYDSLREPKVEGGSPDWPWGTYSRACPKCGASRLPGKFEYCGRCGSPLG